MDDKEMIPNALRKLLEKQHYEFAGNHTAVKICEWTKKSLRNQGVCYKERFYNIKSHLCCQMSPSVNFCSQSCVFCWRPLDYNLGMKIELKDDPKEIIDKCTYAQRKKLSGFWGNDKVNKIKLREAQNPKMFAISLSGEPTFYSKLPQLIDELKKRKIISFLVTNGTNPPMIRKLLRHQPTQLYITLPAPDEGTYEKICRPLVKNQWKKILESLSLLKKFKRSVIRLTLVKNINMIKPEKYADLLKKYPADYIEAKGYVWVGYSRQRLEKINMPLHSEIVDFAKEICKYSNLNIIDEQKPSRVVLLMKKDTKDRKIKF